MTRRRSTLRDGITAFAALALLGLVALKIEDGGKSIHSGRFQAVDGDTLRLDDVRLRLKGIDAPEYMQTCWRGEREWPCGREAKKALSALVSTGPVECAGGGEDRYGRTLAVCRSGAMDLNGEMVRRGMAVAYGAYNDEEVAARREGVGLWAGTFDTPEDWRRREAPGIVSNPTSIPVLGYLMNLLGFG